MLSGKTVVLGVTGSIAAYKTAYLASSLKKLNANVVVVMTKNAQQFISPVTFETLTGNKCLTDTFDRDFTFEVEHVSLAKKADIVMLAPATANVIGKLASGIADDMLTTTLMACTCPVYISPAMNTAMYENSIVQENIDKLKRHGYNIIDAAAGRLACGDTGKGKMPEPEDLLWYILRETAFEKDLAGKKVLVTSGATCEAIDPVRYITNHSTGKMGCSIAKQAMLRGAEVTLVAGHMEVAPPPFVSTVNVRSAAEMAKEVKSRAGDMDIIIKAAAVADYRPKNEAQQKIKKSAEDAAIELERTEDILSYLGANKKAGQLICGFSMETENILENSRAKLEKKKADMIVANSLRTEGAGFGTDTNIVTFITKDSQRELPIMSKDEVANELLSELLSLKSRS